MANRSRKPIDLGYYPISVTYIKQLLKNCEQWGYDNKATCKYIAETIIEKIERENPELPIVDSLHSDLISVAHCMNNGARYSRLKFSYKEKC